MRQGDLILWFIPQTPTIVQCWNMSQTGARIQYESLVELQESNCLNCHPPPLTVHNNRELELKLSKELNPGISMWDVGIASSVSTTVASLSLLLPSEYCQVTTESLFCEYSQKGQSHVLW